MEQGQNKRILFLLLILIAATLIGVARLIDLQIIRGPYFKTLAQGNRLRRIPIKAPRGEIIDRNGQVLTRNAPIYKLATFSSSGIITETQEITREEALNIQANDPEKATRIIIDIGREYPLGQAAAHLVGYVSQASKEEVGQKGCENKGIYTLGDIVGRMGVEQTYDCLLRGVNGEELLEVDTYGVLVRRLGKKEPIPGKTIKLSISANLQQKAYESLLNAPDEDGLPRPILSLSKEKAGGVVKAAFVAQDPETGEVLSLVSVPSFDPNKIKDEYGKFAADENLPLFNRAISGTYPPGSTFKIAVAVAGLEVGKIDSNYQFEDKGFIEVNNFRYNNWYFTEYGGREGFINLSRAITRSTDTFFYKVGELVGIEGLAQWGENLGFGSKTGIDLPGESEGLMPNPNWKQETKGERWFLGNTYHVAIGQGDVLATPLQINQMTSSVANNGFVCTPKIKKLENEKSLETGDWKLENCRDLGLGVNSLQLIKEGMIGACSTGGTAFPFFDINSKVDEEKRVGCKTGTAQFAPSDKTHAWLTAFWEGMSATILVEAGGEGSRVAAPVMKEIYNFWLNNSASVH